MKLTNANIAKHLQSWAAFFSNELWLDQQAQRPLEDALDAILAGPPAWVTRDPLPARRSKKAQEPALEALLIAAWCSGNAKLTALADQCEELGAHYMLTQNKRPH